MRSGVRRRPAHPDDAAAVTALINERELRDRGVAEVTVAAVRAHWATPDVEIAVDGLVGEADGRVVCAALATRDREFVYVATDQERCGLGTRLLEWVMARSVARGAEHHLQIVGSENASAARLLRGAGYERVRRLHRMRLTLEPADAAPTIPAGVEIRSVDLERDARELHALDAATFAANADYRPETFHQFRDEHLRSPDLDPTATLAAVEGGRIAGFLIGVRRQRGRIGYVSLLGVGPSARRRGVATALMRAAFVAWGSAAIARAELTVASDNPDAMALYERLGMQSVYTLDTFERPLRA